MFDKKKGLQVTGTQADVFKPHGFGKNPATVEAPESAQRLAKRKGLLNK